MMVFPQCANVEIYDGTTVWRFCIDRALRQKAAGEICQPACKPGSVGNGHSSGTPIAGRLEQPTRVTGVKTRLRAGFPRTRPPLFGLAPGGVCRAAPVTSRAVRSYRTKSEEHTSELQSRENLVCRL